MSEKVATVTIKHKKGTVPLSDAKHKKAIKDALTEVFGEGHTVKVEVATADSE